MKRQNCLLAFLGGVWILLVLGGLLILAREEFTPVKSVHPSTTFPEGSAIPLSRTQPTLILFVHPLCPCTRASFHELQNLLTEVSRKVSVIIVFTIPERLPSDWKQGDLWRSAQTFSGVWVMEDQGGIEARRFNVAGSGHCLLYAPSKALLFSGGITASRGHEGENPGRLALTSFITTGRASIDETPVFGCSLL